MLAVVVVGAFAASGCRSNLFMPAAGVTSNYHAFWSIVRRRLLLKFHSFVSLVPWSRSCRSCMEDFMWFYVEYCFDRSSDGWQVVQ